MKFGILTLFHDRMEEPIANFNLLNPGSIVDPVHNIKQAIKCGFRNFEITYDVNTMLPGIFDESKIQSLLSLKDKYNLTFSVHLPLWSVELACPHPYIRDAGKNLIIDSINTMEPLEPEAYILHATGSLAAEFLRMKLPPHFDSFLAKFMLKHSIDAVEQILNSTGVSSRKIAVECIEFPFDYMDDMIKRFDLSVCMDVGHIIAGYSGNTTCDKFLHKYYDRIIEIHFHDAYRRKNGTSFDVADHLAIGKGELDTTWLLNELLRRGYNKRMIFELSLKDSMESLNVLSKQFDIDIISNTIKVLSKI